MRIEMVKLTKQENKDNERLVFYTKQEFLETFGFQYELCIDTPEQTAIIKSYPVELQDVLTECFYNTAVNYFWYSPMIVFNQKMLDYYLNEYGNKEGVEMIWLFNEYSA